MENYLSKYVLMIKALKLLSICEHACTCLCSGRVTVYYKTCKIWYIVTRITSKLHGNYPSIYSSSSSYRKLKNNNYKEN